MPYPGLAHDDHRILGSDYCSGFTDIYGKWNTGFYCPQTSPTIPVFCCGTTYYKYCCVAKQGSLNGRQISSTVDDDLTDISPYTVRIPILFAIFCGVLAVVLLLVTGVCFFCSCCAVYKRKRESNRDNASLSGLYHIQAGSSPSSLYSNSVVTTPLDSLSEWSGPYHLPIPSNVYSNPSLSSTFSSTGRPTFPFNNISCNSNANTPIGSNGNFPFFYNNLNNNNNLPARRNQNLLNSSLSTLSTISGSAPTRYFHRAASPYFPQAPPPYSERPSAQEQFLSRAGQGQLGQDGRSRPQGTFNVRQFLLEVDRELNTQRAETLPLSTLQRLIERGSAGSLSITGGDVNRLNAINLLVSAILNHQRRTSLASPLSSSLSPSSDEGVVVIRAGSSISSGSGGESGNNNNISSPSSGICGSESGESALVISRENGDLDVNVNLEEKSLKENDGKLEKVEKAGLFEVFDPKEDEQDKDCISMLEREHGKLQEDLHVQSKLSFRDNHNHDRNLDPEEEEEGKEKVDSRALHEGEQAADTSAINDELLGESGEGQGIKREYQVLEIEDKV